MVMLKDPLGGKAVKTCKHCSHENQDNAKICDKCGQLLQDPGITTQYNDTDYEEGTPKWGSARFNGSLVLDVLETEKAAQFSFNADDIEQVVIGRGDPNSGDKPEVDLTDSDALGKGVSRKHAMIVRRDGALHIVDNSSANGTFLNGQRLVAMQPRILRDGDDIRLGHLVMRVTFRPH